MSSRARVLPFAVTPRRRPSAQAVRTRPPLTTLIDDLTLLALERPASVQVFAELVHRAAARVRHRLQG